MAGSVIAPMIGMVCGALVYIAALWTLRRSKVFDAFDVGLGGVTVAAFVGGFVGYKIFELAGGVAG
jgi:membrane protein CcdC involved in cytochrome C biogenesis